MLCTHKTASSASLVLEICPNFANSFLHQFSSIFGGNCIIGDSKSTSQPDTFVQVSEGARQEPAIHPPMEQPLQSDLDLPIEEQANPRILAPPQQLPQQDEELPVASLVPPPFEEETPPATTTRSGRAIRPTA